MALSGRSVDELNSGYVGVYVIEVTGAEDSFPVNPNTALAAGWADIGYTQEGTGYRFRSDRSFTDIRVEEEVLPVATYENEQTTTLETTLMQSSLDHLRVAFGGGTIQVDTPAIGYNTWEPPAVGDDKFWKIVIRTYSTKPAAGNRLRDILIEKARPIGGIDMPFRRVEPSTLAVQFKILVPDAGGELGGKPWRVIDDISV